MFASVLIANRGEIACRIIRTARAMGLRTIAVYSAADRDARHVEIADEAYPVGGPRANESYLHATNIVAAARASGAECVHPGYGFLAENPAFAEACNSEGTVFIGPPVTAIRAMGRKDEAKQLMREAGIPVLPGHDGDRDDGDGLARAAEEIGYPVMVKAVAGGGGTGMRRVAAPGELRGALEAARREAMSAFGDARLIIEKCLDRPRHIEVQVLADTNGHCVHLFERDCSLQRRHQKVIEEAPAPGMTAGLRGAMTSAAVAAARAVGYVGAGTVEFLVEDGTLNDSSNFYFLEMNTRLQVEHPVTEEIAGLDLVEWQFRIAAGEPLGISQDDLTIGGHAVEARVYAEDPDRGFVPSAGSLHLVRWPSAENIRVDAGVRTGDGVSPFYDPMLAKIICKGDDRPAAVAGLKAALAETAIAGIRTNLAFLDTLLDSEDFVAGTPDTDLIGREFAEPRKIALDASAAKAGIRALLDAKREAIDARLSRRTNDPHSPWNRKDAFSLAGLRSIEVPFVVNGETVRAVIGWNCGAMTVRLPGRSENADGAADGRRIETVFGNGRAYVLHGLRQTEVAFADSAIGDTAGDAEGGVIRAPMHGRLTKIHVRSGEAVDRGQIVAVLEAMKMEHRLLAAREGVVSDIQVAEGQQVSEGAVILSLDVADET